MKVIELFKYKISAVRWLFVVIFLVMLAELLVMFLLAILPSSWFAGLSIFQLGLLDALFLGVVVTPLLYLWGFRQLQQSENRLRRVIESAQDAIVIVNQYNQIIGWNRAAERVFQYSSVQAIGHLWAPLLVPQRHRDVVVEQFSSFWQRLKAGQIDGVSEVVGLRRDGSELALEVSVSLVEELQGSYIYAVVRDVSERQRFETELLQNRERYQLVVQGGHTGIWDWDIRTNECYFSDLWCRLLGYSPGELVPQKISWDQLIHPDDVSWMEERLRRHLERHEPYNVECRMRTKGGDYRWYEISGLANWSQRGLPTQMAGAISDITERKWTELIQQFLSSHSADKNDYDFFLALAVFISDLMLVDTVLIGQQLEEAGAVETLVLLHDGVPQQQLRFEMQDTPFVGIFGKEVVVYADQVSDKFPLDMLLQEYRSQGFMGACLYRTDGRKIGVLAVSCVGPILNATAKVPFVQMVAHRAAMALERMQHDQVREVMLRDANNARRMLLSVIEDRKRSEEALYQLDTMFQTNRELNEQLMAHAAELEQARIVAESASQAKSDFLATMSHEIRTPMNGVIGMLDVLKQYQHDEQQQETINVIYDSAFSLLAIVNDILDFSKIEAGKLQIDDAMLDIADLMERSCETLDQLASKAGVVLRLFIDPSLPRWVRGDPVRLRQVLTNLVNNAIKFSGNQARKGRVSLRVELLSKTAEQAQVQFVITDNGVGMDQQTLNRLFNPFTQADSSTTRKFGGTGLGLVISRQLVNLMGGDIEVESRLGEGAVFRVILPFMLQAHSGSSLSYSLHGLSCLLLENGSGLMGDIAAWLRADGVELEIFEQPVEMWRSIVNSGLDRQIVLLDGVENHLDVNDFRQKMGLCPATKLTFVLLEQGQRRLCRQPAIDLVTLDVGPALWRTVREAVGVAGGRVVLERRKTVVAASRKKIIVPTREQALAQRQLILVAEDNQTNQKVVIQQLALLGRAADVAANGVIALKMWQSGDYALLLSDLDMPEMDGYALTRAIREAEAGQVHIPIIAFSANVMTGEIVQCKAVGMDDHLGKPVQLSALKAMLDRWLPQPVVADGVVASVPSVSPAAIEPPAVSAAVLDLSVLQALVGNEPELLAELLLDYKNGLSGIAPELMAAGAASDLKQVASLAHKLKSSSRSVGALALGDLCAEIERVCKAKEQAVLPELLSRFEQEWQRVEARLEQ